MMEMTRGQSLKLFWELNSKSISLFLVGMLARGLGRAKLGNLGSNSVGHWVPEPGIMSVSHESQSSRTSRSHRSSTGRNWSRTLRRSLLEKDKLQTLLGVITHLHGRRSQPRKKLKDKEWSLRRVTKMVRVVRRLTKESQKRWKADNPSHKISFVGRSEICLLLRSTPRSMCHHPGTRIPSPERPASVLRRYSRLRVKRARGLSPGNECVLPQAQPVDKGVNCSSLG